MAVLQEQELLPPPGDVPWVDEEIRWLVEDLDESEAARLVVELKRDRG